MDMLFTVEKGTKKYLTPDEQTLIAKSYNQKEITAEEAKELELILKALYHSKKERKLHCGCMALEIAHYSRFCIKRSDSVYHTKDCILKNRPDRTQGIKSPSPRPSNPVIDLLGDQRLSRTVAESNQPKQEKGTRTSSRRRINKLVATMYRLLDQAKCHISIDNEKTISETKNSIMEAASTFQVHENTKFDQLLSVNKLDFSHLTEQLLNKPMLWPKEKIWHQVVLYSCDYYEKKDNNIIMYCSKQKGKEAKVVKIKNYSRVKISTPGYLSNKKDGPFLLMFVFKLAYSKNNNPYPKLTKCASIYISNRHELMPLESEYERHMLVSLKNYRSKKNIEFTIEKPIFDTTEGIRPDFIIGTSKENSIAIEVAGFDSDEYRQSKSITHPIMKEKYNHFLEYKAYEGSSYKKSMFFLLKNEIDKKIVKSS